MPLNCPVCRAGNDAGPACRRCRADLALCFAVERQRAAALASARKAAAQGDLPWAFSQVGRAAAIRRGDDVQQLRAALAVLAGDFAGAWEASRA